MSPIGVDLFGVSFLLEAERGELVSAVVSRLPAVPFAPIGGDVARRYVVEDATEPVPGLFIRRGARKTVLAASVETAADLIVHDLQRTLAHRADGLVFVHAGVVAWHGRALVLPGRSRSGKSELVGALVRAGAAYLSDEFAVLDGDGLVHPYARPIGFRQPDGTRAWVAAEALGARLAARPVPLGLIAFVRFTSGGRWRPRPLSAGETFLGLLRHTVAARRRLTLARSILVPLASSVAGLRAVRGEADDVAGELLAEVASARASA